jgi:hypothetical protein
MFGYGYGGKEASFSEYTQVMFVAKKQRFSPTNHIFVLVAGIPFVVSQ